MFMTRSEYDRGVTTFSPEGRLFQVEYAIEAIKLGSTAIAILTKEGIVLAVERRTQSPLMVPSSLDKIMEIDSHVACAVSGLTADAQSMVEHGHRGVSAAAPAPPSPAAAAAAVGRSSGSRICTMGDTGPGPGSDSMACRRPA